MDWAIKTVAAAMATFREINLILAQDRWKRFKPSTVRERQMIRECFDLADRGEQSM